MQYAVTCAMVFCAECWPMHVWQGFGCGIMNFTAWVDVRRCNEYCVDMDMAIAALKAKPYEWHLLKKSPVLASGNNHVGVPVCNASGTECSSPTQSINCRAKLASLRAFVVPRRID